MTTNQPNKKPTDTPHQVKPEKAVGDIENKGQLKQNINVTLDPRENTFLK